MRRSLRMLRVWFCLIRLGGGAAGFSSKNLHIASKEMILVESSLIQHGLHGCLGLRIPNPCPCSGSSKPRLKPRKRRRVHLRRLSRCDRDRDTFDGAIIGFPTQFHRTVFHHQFRFRYRIVLGHIGDESYTQDRPFGRIDSYLAMICGELLKEVPADTAKSNEIMRVGLGYIEAKNCIWASLSLLPVTPSQIAFRQVPIEDR